MMTEHELSSQRAVGFSRKQNVFFLFSSCVQWISARLDFVILLTIRCIECTNQVDFRFFPVKTNRFDFRTNLSKFFVRRFFPFHFEKIGRKTKRISFLRSNLFDASKHENNIGPNVWEQLDRVNQSGRSIFVIFFKVKQIFIDFCFLTQKSIGTIIASLREKTRARTFTSGQFLLLSIRSPLIWASIVSTFLSLWMIAKPGAKLTPIWSRSLPWDLWCFPCTRRVWKTEFSMENKLCLTRKKSESSSKVEIDLIERRRNRKEFWFDGQIKSLIAKFASKTNRANDEVIREKSLFLLYFLQSTRNGAWRVGFFSDLLITKRFVSKRGLVK